MKRCLDQNDVRRGRLRKTPLIAILVVVVSSLGFITVGAARPVGKQRATTPDETSSQPVIIPERVGGIDAVRANIGSEWFNKNVHLTIEGEVKKFQLKETKDDHLVPQAAKDLNLAPYIPRWWVDTDGGRTIHFIDFTLDFIEHNDRRNPYPVGSRFRFYLTEQQEWGGYVLQAAEAVSH